MFARMPVAVRWSGVVLGFGSRNDRVNEGFFARGVGGPVIGEVFREFLFECGVFCRGFGMRFQVFAKQNVGGPPIAVEFVKIQVVCSRFFWSFHEVSAAGDACLTFVLIP